MTVHPPEIDEANAVAINFLRSPKQGRKLGNSFYLIAYDFGGGTIDTSVLQVRFADADGVLRTRYIGLGGLSHFGGDEVTPRS